MEPLTHRPSGSNRDWNESYYFIFFDRQHNIGGMSRIGFKPNIPEGMTFLFLFLPDGTVAAYHTVDEGKSYPKRLRVGEMEHISGHDDRWTYKFSGSMIVVDNPEILPRAREQPDLIKDLVDVSMELSASRINDTYEYSQHMTRESLKIGKKSGDKHWEQILRVSGVLKIGEKTYEVSDCIGQRDHTYGIRDWTGVGDWFYFVVWFDENLAVNPAAVIMDDGRLGTGGFLFSDGENIPIVEIRLRDHTFRADGVFPMSTTMELVDANKKRHILKGRPGPMIPLPFKDKTGKEAFLIQCFGEFELDGRTGGYGSYEVLRKARS